MYNDYIQNHPGNRVWNELVYEKSQTYAAYSSLPAVFRGAVAEYVVDAIRNYSGRFLYQNVKYEWIEVSTEDAVKYTSWQSRLM